MHFQAFDSMKHTQTTTRLCIVLIYNFFLSQFIVVTDVERQVSCAYTTVYPTGKDSRSKLMLYRCNAVMCNRERLLSDAQRVRRPHTVDDVRSAHHKGAFLSDNTELRLSVRPVLVTTPK